jgi:LmbE family N-acetylglucosaminyl deacetylase
MLSLGLDRFQRVLCLGAHADDIEIGCGGALLRLIAENPEVSIHWAVFSATDARAAEARASYERFLGKAARRQLELFEFNDRYFPTSWAEIKGEFDRLSRELRPDLIFTHRRDDAHQDHRVLAELTWNAFRDHTILEYEIPKYEGDLGQPNVFVPLAAEVAQRKAELIVESFATQRDKFWFSADTFLALARLRGVECAAPEGYAEGFYARKLTF